MLLQRKQPQVVDTRQKGRQLTSLETKKKGTNSVLSSIAHHNSVSALCHNVCFEVVCMKVGIFYPIWRQSAIWAKLHFSVIAFLNLLDPTFN